MRASILSLLGLAAYASATINWTTCAPLPKSDQSVFKCATLDVPLDYQLNTSTSNTLQLNLLKYLAPKQPSKGTVLFNPGGPGSSGRTELTTDDGYLAKLVSAYSAFEYDIVTWDPRGTGTTIPAVCFTSETQRDAIVSKVPSISRSNFNSSVQAGWTLAGSLASACKSALNATGSLIGTAYTARDMVQIVDALGEDGLLRYYGVSYGTALGQVFAAMFPDKVERMVLDGVLNPHQYIAGLDYQQLASTDAVFAGFLSACLSRPELCPLAGLDLSTQNLAQQFDLGITQLQNNPSSYGSNLTQEINTSTVRQLILSNLYTPSTWPVLSALLAGVLTQNTTEIAASLKLLTATPGATEAAAGFKDLSNVETILAIRCSDVSLRTNSVAQIMPIALNFLNQSPQLASYLIASQPLVCAQWPFNAKERYSGNFDVQTKHPILFIGNVFDPITSLDAARNASATFNGSGLLVHQGYGHSSEKQLSKCTIDASASYFTTGKLPAANTVCIPDIPIFATVKEQAAVEVALLTPSNSSSV